MSESSSDSASLPEPESLELSSNLGCVSRLKWYHHKGYLHRDCVGSGIAFVGRGLELVVVVRGEDGTDSVFADDGDDGLSATWAIVGDGSLSTVAGGHGGDEVHAVAAGVVVVVAGVSAAVRAVLIEGSEGVELSGADGVPSVGGNIFVEVEVEREGSDLSAGAGRGKDVSTVVGGLFTECDGLTVVVTDLLWKGSLGAEPLGLLSASGGWVAKLLWAWSYRGEVLILIARLSLVVVVLLWGTWHAFFVTSPA